MPSNLLVLRTCSPDMTSHGGFKWPKSGPVEAPDWSPKPECGQGLHGLLWGEGEGTLLSWDPDAKWLVVEVPEDTIVDLKRKVKFPRGEVVFAGDRKGATDYILARHAGSGVVGAFVTVGDYGVASVGYRGTATAGERGTATAGERGTATAGYRGTATAGERGTATAGYMGTATAGDGGTATAGYGGTATAGYRGTATAGYGGTATAGAYGTATASYGGAATAGEGGELRIQWYDPKLSRYRTVVGLIGEDGLLPDVPYVVSQAGKLERKQP